MWIAVAIVAPALAFGIPLGIVAGRWGWRIFAEYLAVVPDPVTPVAGALLVAVVAVAVAVVIALELERWPPRPCDRPQDRVRASEHPGRQATTLMGGAVA